MGKRKREERKEGDMVNDRPNEKKTKVQYKYECKQCCYKTDHSDHFRNHERIHTGENSYKCTSCTNAFARKESLTRHIRTHIGEKLFPCKNCPMAFARKDSLTKHVRTHTGEKPFKCTICTKSFTQSGHLTKHIRTHTGEKPFKCTICTKSFTQSEHLTMHIRTHTGEKPFKCTICMKCFTKNGDLTDHVQRHKGEKPYECTYPTCDASFVRRAEMNIHFQRMHTKEGQQRQKKKENKLFKTLSKTHGLTNIEREYTIQYSCFQSDNKLARIDGVRADENQIQFIECDEQQHKHLPSVSCDIKRMMDVVSAIRSSGDERAIVWFRFNPDVFRCDNQKMKVVVHERTTVLANLLKTHQPLNSVEIIYLFYDTDTEGIPDICDDREFSEQVKELIIPFIFSD